jgi:hypothetical protein
MIKFYHLLCVLERQGMVPTVWAKDALKVINDIDQRIAGGTVEVRATNFLLQRFSRAVQRGNGSQLWRHCHQEGNWMNLSCSSLCVMCSISFS